MAWKENDAEKRKAYQALWYQKNKSEHMRRARKKQIDYRQWLQSLKIGKRCVYCGEDHPACLAFHHVNPSVKAFNIADAARTMPSKARLLAELDKCEIVCANCHAKLHWKEDNNTP
ncbi:MAG: hypothetical protein ACJ8CR_01320 [Roseiflexaceae bacterium]